MATVEPFGNLLRNPRIGLSWLESFPVWQELQYTNSLLETSNADTCIYCPPEAEGNLRGRYLAILIGAAENLDAEFLIDAGAEVMDG